MMSIYYKMNWYMQWMLAEHWDSAFRTKVSLPSPRGQWVLLASRLCPAQALELSQRELVTWCKASLLTRSRSTSKEEMMQEGRARLLTLASRTPWRVIPASQRLLHYLNSSVGTALQSFFSCRLVLLPSLPYKRPWESSEASHVQTLPQSLFPRPHNLTANITKEVFFFSKLR